MTHNTQTLLTRITQSIEELAQATDHTQQSASLQQYLDYCARFHHYSLHNICLILLHDPQASQVAGYRAWQQLGRQVKKGECGIPILAPTFRKEENEHGEKEQYLTGFRTVYVFDIRQTEGEPLPEAPEWRSLAKDEDLEQALYQYARMNNINVEVKAFRDDTQGASFGGRIQLAPGAGTKTLIHELAHELLHQPHSSLPVALMECDAEGVAYVVSKHCQLPELRCPTYLALHGLAAKDILAHLERIRATSAQLITYLSQAVGHA
jgi:hypothetical protein